jgi:hypothetical protein
VTTRVASTLTICAKAHSAKTSPTWIGAAGAAGAQIISWLEGIATEEQRFLTNV